MPFNTVLFLKGKYAIQQLLIVNWHAPQMFKKKKKTHANVLHVIPPQTLSKTWGAFVLHESQDFEAEESLRLLHMLLKTSNFRAKNREVTGCF